MRFETRRSDRPRGTEPTAVSWGESATSAEEPTGTAGSGKTGRKRRSLVGTVIETLLIVGAAFAIAMVVQTFMFRITGILQTSMLPTVEPGDRIIVNCLTYHFREPERGEVVVIRDPLDEKKDIVKRIVALGGDTIEVRDGELYINGGYVEEPYVANKDPIKGQEALLVPEGFIYVMGDNRPVSGDSRNFGPVSENRIVGRVVCILWPFSRWGGL